MKVMVDLEADAAYIYLVDIPKGGVSRTAQLAGHLNVDFDKMGRVVGIELLSIAYLPTELLAEAMKTTGKGKA